MPQTDPARDREIAQVRRTATGILFGLSVVFLATFASDEPSWWVLLVRAMAEAGMIGGIADWFAVEALFRRPLGLPIPHTALLPNNQKRAADNVARFVDENFLAPEHLIEQVRKVRPVRRLADWLSRPANARILGRELSGFLHLILKSQLQARIGTKAGPFLSRSLASSLDSGLLAEQITTVLKGSVHSDLLDQILQRVRKVLDGNREKVTELVQDRSRWWIASSVDRKVVALLVDGMLSVVDELSENGSALRDEFEDSVEKIIAEMHDDGVVQAYLDQGLKEFTSSPEYQSLLGDLVQSVLSVIERDMNENPERFAEILSEAIAGFARHIQDSPELETDLEQRLFTALDSMLVELRPFAIRYISQTIASWDSEELVARMEQEVGRDLQFIRINGSVLGAMVGGVIHLATQFLH